MSKNKKSKKIWIFLLLAVVLIVGVLFWIKPWQSRHKDDSERDEGKILYYTADFDADIMQNKVYLSYDRGLLFGTPYQQLKYDFEADYDKASKEAKFFLDYFDCLIRGDETEIVSFFTEGYFEKNPHFTQQMIHDMSVILHSVERETVDGTETDVYSYTVTYEIFHNNGTWRKGVGSDDARPQIYQLICAESGQYRIFRILDVMMQ